MIVDKTHDPVFHAAMLGLERIVSALTENAVSEIKHLTEEGNSNEKCRHIASLTASEIEHITVVSRLVRYNTK